MGKSSIANEIKKNRIKQANKFIKTNKSGGSKVWRMMHLIDAMNKMKDTKFWLNNRNATVIELLDIMKIPKMKKYDILSMKGESIIDRINLMIGETTTCSDVDKLDSVISAKTSGGIIRRLKKTKKH